MTPTGPAGGPATPSAARNTAHLLEGGDTAPLLEGVRGVDDVGIKDSGREAGSADKDEDLKGGARRRGGGQEIGGNEGEQGQGEDQEVLRAAFRQSLQ